MKKYNETEPLAGYLVGIMYAVQFESDAHHDALYERLVAAARRKPHEVKRLCESLAWAAANPTYDFRSILSAVRLSNDDLSYLFTRLHRELGCGL